MGYYTEGQLLISSSVSSNRIYSGGDKYSNAKALWGIVKDRRYREAPTYFKEVSVHGIPLPDSTTIDYLRTEFDWFGNPRVSTGTITPSSGETTKPENDRYRIRALSYGSGWYYGYGMSAYYGEQLPTDLFDYNKPYVEIVGIPVFYYEDHEAIQAYIDRGDISGALNADELIEKLYANWKYAYTRSDDTIYSIAVNCPQFYDGDSRFYGLADIATVHITGDYYIGDTQVSIYNITLPYGQTWQGQLSNIIGQSNTDIATKLANKIASITSIANLTLSAYVSVVVDNEEVQTPIVYVEYNHSNVEGSGFRSDITEDTLNIIGGTVLSDDDSDTSNPDYDKAEGEDTDIYAPPEVQGSGLLTKTYGLTPEQAQGLGAFLWGASFLTDLSLVNNNPIENIVSCKLFPLDLSEITGQATTAKVGNVDTGTPCKRLDDNLLMTSSGTFKITEHFTDNLRFLNYAPYTKIEIFLPFIGLKELPVNMIMGSSIEVVWIIDIITGTLQTNIHSIVTELHEGQTVSRNRHLFTYNSNIGIDIPLTGQNLSQIESAYIQNAIGGGMSLASGNIAGAVQAGVNIATTQHHSTTTGTPSPATATCGELRPYLLITRPELPRLGGSDMATYKKLKGCPALCLKKLGDVRGFCQVDKPDVQVEGATVAEIEEINRLLAEGIYIGED